jgi:hypothetical protein
MRRRDFLHPAKVDGVIDVLLLIDVSRLNRDSDFERVRRELGFHDKTWRAGEAGVTIPA